MKKFKFIGCNFFKKEVRLMSKKICVGVLFIILCMFGACSGLVMSGSDCYDHVFVYINEDNEEYNKKFDNREFAPEDFNLSNTKDFFYHYLYYPPYNTGRFFSLYLNKTGKSHAKKAVEHLSKLEFVDRARFGFTFKYCARIQDEYSEMVLVYIREEIEEYRRKFGSQTFTIEDFEWDNVKDIFGYYRSYSQPASGRFIALELIETGEEHIEDAIEHLNTLEFVGDAVSSYNPRPSSRFQKEYFEMD